MSRKCVWLNVPRSPPGPANDSFVSHTVQARRFRDRHDVVGGISCCFLSDSCWSEVC